MNLGSKVTIAQCTMDIAPQSISLLLSLPLDYNTTIVNRTAKMASRYCGWHTMSTKFGYFPYDDHLLIPITPSLLLPKFEISFCKHIRYSQDVHRNDNYILAISAHSPARLILHLSHTLLYSRYSFATCPEYPVQPRTETMVISES